MGAHGPGKPGHRIVRPNQAMVFLPIRPGWVFQTAAGLDFHGTGSNFVSLPDLLK